jgi:hypothetical protein
MKNIEKIIESVKNNLIQRSSPLNLLLEGKTNIKTAARVLKRLEQERDVT